MGDSMLWHKRVKSGLSYTRVGFIGKAPFRPSPKPSFSAQYCCAKPVSGALITHFNTNSYSNLLPSSLHFGKMGKGSKRGKTYMKASRKAAALPVKGANSTHMTKGRLATERQERNHQRQEVMEVITPTKLPMPARESIRMLPD
jgi:hypothetical protein